MFTGSETMAYTQFSGLKTEVVLFGPSDLYDFGDIDLGKLSSYVTPCVKNLGVLFDSGLKFDKQIMLLNHVSIIYDISQKLNLFSL